MLRTASRVLPLLAILVAAVAMFGWWRAYGSSRNRFETWEVRTGDVVAGVTISSTIRTRQKTSVAAEVLAMVRELKVEENQHVAAGDVLLELDDSMIAAEAAKAQARLDVARHALAELRAGARPEEKRLAELAVEQAQSQLSFAESEHRRVEALTQRGGASATEIEQAANQLRTARIDLDAARARLALLNEGARPEQVARAEAEVRLAEADVEGIAALRRKYVLQARHAGVVTARYVRAGEVVAPNQPLLRLDDVEDLEIEAQAQETQLAGIRPGAVAHVLADAWPDHLLEATVSDILPRVDAASGTVPIKLSLRGDPEVMLMDGMAADVALTHDRREGVLCVPSRAVERRGGGRGLVWVRDGGSFERRQVELGLDDGQMVEVVSGVKAGDVVRLP